MEKKQHHCKLFYYFLLIAIIQLQISFAQQMEIPKKIGVLLVSHGSRSTTWRNSLLALEETVRAGFKKNNEIQKIETAFMEYTEPSIATQLKEFDKNGFTDVILIPVFLTISTHTFEDIPTIIGKKIDPNSLETLKIENIERYTPKARILITTGLDFTDILHNNIIRRVLKLSKNPKEEGVVMIAYGDATYEKEWSSLLENIGGSIKKIVGISTYSYGWCGHIVHYDPEKTTEAIKKILIQKKKAIVIPVLVSHDEMFQIKIIGDGIANVKENKTRVLYKPDSILPDPNVTEWIIHVTNESLKEILDSPAATR